jgi:ATP-dependent DNA helicase RecG
MTFEESELVELKSIVTEDIQKEIIAFANRMGGKIYIGVANDGKVLGVDDPDACCLQISNMVRDTIKPDLSEFIHYETLDISDKRIVMLEIAQGSLRPYYIAKKGMRPEGVYVRQGTSSAPASNAAIRQMIKESDGDHFEEMRCLEQHLTFEQTKKEFTSRNIPFEMAQMKTLGLLFASGIYTNLGLLLSDQCTHTIKVAVFGQEGLNQFQDRKEFCGSLLKQMNDVYDFLDFRNQTRSTFEKLYRLDRKDYPEVALREALLNMLVHRDYAFSASAFIRMYTDRIEFVSVGGLVSGITLEDISMGISVCRNAKLAYIFYRLELIEAYGTGIQKIMDAYQENSRKPEIQISNNAFKIILPNRNADSFQEESKNQQAQARTLEEEIILMTKKQGFVTRKEVESLLDMPQTSCGRLLKKMVDHKELIQKGKGKATRYYLSEHGLAK